MIRKKLIFLPMLAAIVCAAQSTLPPPPAPLGVPAPGPSTDAPYAPLPILPGGVVITLYPPASPYLNQEKVRQAEQYNMSQAVPGRINSIVNIHNPSIEVHTVDRGLNTGAAVILVPGGGHNTLNVGSEGADFVPFFYNYGVNTIILRSRLRETVTTPAPTRCTTHNRPSAWYEPTPKTGTSTPTRSASWAFPQAPNWPPPPRFSTTTSIRRTAARATHSRAFLPARTLSASSTPAPRPFARDRVAPPIPHNVPPSFIASAGSDDQIHAIWADEYFAAMLALRVPNLEMHIYANGRHPGDPLRDGSHMTGGLTDRKGIPFGTWQYRFIDWFRDLGFLGSARRRNKGSQRHRLLFEPASDALRRASRRRDSTSHRHRRRFAGLHLHRWSLGPEGSGRPVARRAWSSDWHTFRRSHVAA